ncbi:MAG: hypothetical protein C4312_01500 [Thermoflexus sp.]
MRNHALPSPIPWTGPREVVRPDEWFWLRSSLVLLDGMALAIAFILSYGIRFETRLPIFYQPESPPLRYYVLLMAGLIPIWLLLFAAHRLYAPDHLFHGTSEYMQVIQAASMGMVATIVFSFMEPALVVARGWLLLSWLLAIATVSAGRFLSRRLVTPCAPGDACWSPPSSSGPTRRPAWSRRNSGPPPSPGCASSASWTPITPRGAR